MNTKNLNFIGTLLILGMFFSCNNNDGSTQEQEAQNLNQMLSEIESLANSEKCTDPEEWTVTSYGSKACGGPVGFIAYSSKIDTELFLEKIEEHRVAQEEFNQKWGILSDCSVPPEPTGIICENESPVFEY
jgi:hypothetical protein